MITFSSRRVLLLLVGVGFLLMGCIGGCAGTDDKREIFTPVYWAENDHQGKQAGSLWAGESVKGQWAGLRVAVLPVHNMTALPVPLEDMEKMFYVTLRKGGLRVLEKAVLEDFMAKRRIRYTGGVDRVTASAMREEAGVDVVLISSLEHFDDGDPPRISLHSRLVSLGQDLEIQWMDSYCRAGDDSPGFLDLGVIRDSHTLMEAAVDQLARSMMLHLAGKSVWNTGGDQGPESLAKDRYRSPGMNLDNMPTIAVMPFLNHSERSHAWEILPLHFVHHLAGLPGVRIMEPGEVRLALLNSRVFLQGGLSLPNLELVLRSTGADFVLTGTVMRYLDTRAVSKDPEVEFSVEMFDRNDKEIVWSSRSSGKGSDGVFFFGAGRKSTACSLADSMVGATVSGIALQTDNPKTTTNTINTERVLH